MKKNIFTLCTIMFLCAGAFALEATVVSVSGRVEYQANGDWFTLEQEAKIEKNTVISTGYKSQAVIQFKGSTFTLGALTRVTIESLLEEENRDTAELFIDTGKISANVNGANGKRVGFRVRSPYATAAVRGTSFTFYSSGILNVEHGVVSLAPSSYQGEKGVPVAANHTSKVNQATEIIAKPSIEKRIMITGGEKATTRLATNEAIKTSDINSTPTGSSITLPSNTPDMVVVSLDFSEN